jgi:hypothetical protein
MFSNRRSLLTRSGRALGPIGEAFVADLGGVDRAPEGPQGRAKVVFRKMRACSALAARGGRRVRGVPAVGSSL